MNFANDQVMEQQLENVKRELLTKTAEEYRDSAVARARLKQGLSQLAAQAKQLARADATELVQRFGELGRRKFNLAA
jgi:membrane-bound lytic murein transglycosylase B